MRSKTLTEFNNMAQKATDLQASNQKIACYARVSTAEQANEGVSIDVQLATLRAYAKFQGYTAVKEYVDRGYSGTTDRRLGRGSMYPKLLSVNGS